MQVPLQIVFRNLEPSDLIAAKIRERVTWLEDYYERIISCRVSIEAPHRHHRRGNLYAVKIDLRVPGKELVISRRPDLRGSHRDMQVVIHEAFDEARRALEDYARKRRREVKHRESPQHAVVTRLLREDGGYGFLQAEDGHEIYFDARSVVNGDYDDLEIGTEVRYSEEMGEEGPQASSVEKIGKQGRRFERRSGQ